MPSTKHGGPWLAAALQSCSQHPGSKAPTLGTPSWAPWRLALVGSQRELGVRWC